ncbi:MAG: TetR/AcrR family transcriptional regulator [Acidimicrobiales bacterium]
MEEVAEEAGFSKGAVYSNFATKEELFLTLFEERTEQKLKLIDDVVSRAESLEGRAHEGGERLATVIERNRDWCLLFMEFWASAVRDPAIRRKFAAHYDAMRSRVAAVVEMQAQELGVTLSMPAADVATGLIALGEGFVLQKLADPGHFPQEFGSSMLEMFFTGALAAGEGGEPGEQHR